MPESDELSAAIGHIKYKVDSMDRTLERLLRVSGKAMLEDYVEKLKADPILAKVYLAVDGLKTQQQIAATVGNAESTVTDRVRKLLDMDLIELLKQKKEGKIYQYTKMERLFKIAQRLKKEMS